MRLNIDAVRTAEGGKAFIITGFLPNYGQLVTLTRDELNEVINAWIEQQLKPNGGDEK